MMSNIQFYFAIGVPVFSILLVWLGSTVANNRAIGALGQRIDDLRAEMKAEIKNGFEGVNHRLDRLEARVFTRA